MRSFAIISTLMSLPFILSLSASASPSTGLDSVAGDSIFLPAIENVEQHQQQHPIHRRHHNKHRHGHGRKRRHSSSANTCGGGSGSSHKTKPTNTATGASLKATGNGRNRGSGSRTNSTSTPASSSSSSSSSSAVSAPSSTPSSKTNSTSSGSSSGTSSTTFGINANHAHLNGISFGFLPDDGSGGGSASSMVALNNAAGFTGATVGYYAQAQSGTAFDGSQLLSRMSDIKNSGGVLIASVMPTGGWQGLTSSDNSQAQNIANVMKKFEDQGVQVWLRFAHEMNYYQTDGTYLGGVSDFKQGWNEVAKAVRATAPSVKMFWSPNVADMASYESYFPDDQSTVDIVGVDFYPKDLSSANFVSTMKPFHDRFATNGKIFAIGETGLGFSGGMNERMQWFQQIMSQNTKTQMPKFTNMNWFNYQKGYDFRVAIPGGDSSQLSQLFKSG